MGRTQLRFAGRLLLALLLPAASGIAGQPLENAQLRKLREVKTVHVDPLNGKQGSEQIRDMIIGSLHRTGLFIVTEDDEHADAFLRGSAEDLVFSEYFTNREGLQVRGSASSSRRDDEESNFDSSSFGIGDTDASSRRERKHEASAAVRLVLPSGEVIWSTTQESAGAKYRGPAADVAEKVARELEKAIRAAREERPAASR
jgi:hypothetical protein